MRGHVIVDSQSNVENWLQKLPTFASLQTQAGSGEVFDPVSQGKQLAQVHGCFGCHSIDGSPAVGPTWKDLYGKQEQLTDGRSILVDDDYLSQSITDPNDTIIAGYSPIMPAYNLTQQQLDVLIAYIKSLSSIPEPGASQ
jgi:cytochrome c oxidase subunit 2